MQSNNYTYNNQYNAVAVDRLGSIVVEYNPTANRWDHFAYDAWGRRFYADWPYFGQYCDVPAYSPFSAISLETLLSRGYTGHEHLDMFGLINMNGRLYDPVIGRMLSPDPYVQAPDFTQSFNRYSYCWNNPLSYTDPSGEIFSVIANALKDAFVNTFVKVWKHGINAWTDKDNWQSTTMAWKIYAGLFQGDFWQIISRFTWELPQTLLGYLGSQIHNYFGGVKSIGYYDGATVVESYAENWGAITFGNYIIGDRGITANTCKKENTENCHYSIKFVNNSDMTLYVKYDGFCLVDSPDPFNISKRSSFTPTQKNIKSRDVNESALFSRYCMEDMFRSAIKILYIYVFDAAVVENTPWDIVARDYLVLKRYDLTLEDLQKLDWNITYPPDERMKDIKQYPSYDTIK